MIRLLGDVVVRTGRGTQHTAALDEATTTGGSVERDGASAPSGPAAEPSPTAAQV